VILAINALGIWRLAIAFREELLVAPKKDWTSKWLFHLDIAPEKKTDTIGGPSKGKRSMREAIHNDGAKKPTFRSKCLLNPWGC
jgi:hypothetical protein